MPHDIVKSKDSEGPSRLSIYSMFLTGIVLAFVGIAAGFMYGDSYGRRHAQYDNPVLRDYYAGQCYSFWENNFRKTVRSTLEKPISSDLQFARMDEIRQILLDIQRDLGELGNRKIPAKGNPKKMANSNLQP